MMDAGYFLRPYFYSIDLYRRETKKGAGVRILELGQK